MKKILLSVCLFLSSHAMANPVVIRAAIDIGMGGPKLQVAEVDVETNKIVKELYTQRYFVNFYETISEKENNALSLKAMAEGLDAFKEAVKAAHAFNAKAMVAIATASFRSASNGLEFANTIEQETGIKVHVIDQNLEGKLTFQAALAKRDIQPQNLIVWDIGGGSIQFTSQEANGDYVVNCGEEGVGAFNKYIISHIQDHELRDCKTPNPLSSEEILQAVAYAENLSHKVSKVFKEKIKQPSMKIIGAGNAFGYGISPMMGKNVFSLDEIKRVVHSLANKTDADLGGGEFAFCEATNLLLAYGFMLGLGIDQMEVVPLNNTDGALVYSFFWDE